MFGRSFLSGVGALLGRKAIAVRDQIATRPAAPAPRNEPVDAAKRRDHAMARFILRRLGIAPLAPAIALAMMLIPASGPRAENTAARVTVTARAVILPSSARIQQGMLIVAASRSDSTPLVVRPVERACGPVPEPTTAPCRMIVYDLP